MGEGGAGPRRRSPFAGFLQAQPRATMSPSGAQGGSTPGIDGVSDAALMPTGETSAAMRRRLTPLTPGATTPEADQTLKLLQSLLQSTRGGAQSF